MSVGLALVLSAPALAQKGKEKEQGKAAAPAPAGKEGGGFAESRTGEVPEGTAEMMTPETDRAIKRGLDWLAKQQNADGSFGNGVYRGNVAVTSLSGLAMMASGSSPGRGPYGPQIDRAIQNIMENTSAAGFINVPSSNSHGPMYGHGFGALFLAEAYGMTHRAEIREKLEKAVRLIVDTQNSQGRRYQPVRSEADLSVTICQINALRAARNAGIYVPKATVENCLKYVRQSQNPDGGFRYQLVGGESGYPRSAAGVVALYSVGDYDSKEVASGIAYLKRQLLNEIKFGQKYGHYFYGHYYASQAMWIRGGAEWNLWYPAIRDELKNRQNSQGFWPDSIGNEYGTAMALIILQVPNNYLPIFQR